MNSEVCQRSRNFTFMPSNVFGRKVIISNIVSLNYGSVESSIGVIYVHVCNAAPVLHCMVIKIYSMNNLPV